MTPAPIGADVQPEGLVEPHDVLVVGGGVAGIEALMALADLGDNRLRVRLVADRPSFALPSAALAVPWGTPLVHVDLELLCRAFGARFAVASVTGVDAAAHQVYLAGGQTIAYERLLLAPGAKPEFAYPGTRSIGFGALPGEIAADGSGSIAVVVADGVSWTLPAYQLALSAAGHGRDVRLLTAEREALEAFGPGTHAAVGALLERHGVRIETSAAPVVGAQIHDMADAVIALPLLGGPGIAGLPVDARGFVHVDTRGAVRGHEDVRAAGDATDHAIKQGGLAAQHADIAAAEIVRSCGGAVAPPPYAPVLRGRLTAADGEELYLQRALDGLDAGRASVDPLWQPPSAICAQRLARWLDDHRSELEHRAQDSAALR